jgi:hypothetical protein
MIAATIGSICLGIVMGWLVRYCLDRFRQFTPKVLGSVVSVIVGGAVIHIFQGGDSITRYAQWYYFMGLLGGVLLYPFISQTPKKR